jgi:SSS family solute:Na+ symporter
MDGAFQILDWLVLGAYAVGMMAIGWWYSRVKNVEEYLLGGREMKPWAVGISLFATLMSTLTYLAFPGEMIRHGPMFLSSLLAYPLIYFVVGRLLIPYIMRLKVTSAYEILELRFGLSVRLLGSSIFLLLRLFWMSLIVYASSDAILIPLLGLSDSATPWVCVVMAILTVAYTSMGGLQAVVVTDVIQTFIMLAGAITSLVWISVSLGGIGEWWPRQWASEWDAPSFFFAPQSRISMGMAILSTFVWFLCTAGSDQMAIQRYLATRDAPSARRMFGISLLCESGVELLLAALGFALFAFFATRSDLLPTGETVTTGADKLLPIFIVKVLPAGVSGLVVAGILSAAMDSLSSGLNSSALVVTEDWIGRFRRRPLNEAQQIRELKVISWVVGLAVVAVSLLASNVEGSLLDRCFKVVNLLTAPLFVLFFMAMFIPWATTAGTWIAAIASTFAAVSIAYFGALGLGILWIMPVSLISGIVAGCLASLAPIGRRRPMLGASQ